MSALAHGLLVLGMHRSGTSAVARTLALSGVDLGSRLVGASRGNEAGHWEDANAVDLHERLLGAFGGHWDEPFPLPSDWADSEPAQRAGVEIATYLVTDRAAHGHWAVKDPRLCLFAPLWQAAAPPDTRLASLVVARHPDEVAASLLARDGIPRDRGLLLWFDHVVSALGAAAGMPACFVDYARLLSAPAEALSVVNRLPGWESLRLDATSLALAVEPGRRHHHAGRGSEDKLPDFVREAWQALRDAVQTQVAPSLGALARERSRVSALVRPIAEEWRHERSMLWARAARAEALVASDAAMVPASLDAMREALDRHQQSLVDALSNDVRRMQDVVAQTQASAAAAQLDADAKVRAQEQRVLATEAQQREAESRARVAEEQRQQAEAFRAQAEDLKRRAEQATTEAQTRAQGAEQRAASAESRATSLQTELQLAQANAEEMRRSLTASAEQNDHLQAKLSLENARAAGLEDARHKATEALADLSRRHGELRDALKVGERSLDAARREARIQAEELARLRDKAAQLDTVLRSKSWRLTRPFRAAARLLRGQWDPSQNAALRSSMAELFRGVPGQGGLAGRPELPPLHASPAPLPEDTPGHPLWPAKPGLPDVFIWAVIDWRFRVQRPQHLARALAARGHRVFYLSNEFADAPAPGFRVERIDPALALFQVHLHVPGAPAIYHATPGQADLTALRAGLADVLAWTCSRSALGIVQHPYWLPLVRSLPATRVVYDCMDHHGGFENNAGSVLEAEARLVADADLVIVTSEWLEREIAPQARATATIRNAGEFAHFNARPDKVFADARGRRVIGYYGAIAEWFDAGLVREVATAHADALVVLVGSDTAGVGAALADLHNVRMVGEVPYAELPYWLHGFDVCLLPFKVIPLTLATNPVKVYEYLAAGKPVVSVDLPEMAQFAGCVHVAGDARAFADAVGTALAEAGDASAAAARQAFAAGQTWAHRAQALDHVLETLPEPRVSVVVLTYNNLDFTRACLFSVEAYSDYPNLEVIVVDNASSDGSREWLREWAAEPSDAGHVRKLILNEDNLGFAAGNNVGLRAASGEVLVMLNNDTYVTPGWVRGLSNHLRSTPGLGLVGPVTNNIGNEARVEIQYEDMVQMIERAGQHTRSRPGMRLPLATAAFFCVAMPREVYERVGGLDEQFGVGFFEDDDYCRRVEQAGYAIACAEDVFVHHHLSASFDALKAGQKQALFERNKALYEAKWGEWKPHSYRQASDQSAA